MPTCLIEFVTSKLGEEEKQKQKQLEEELKGINDYLERHGPFFGGDNVTTHDLTLAPKIKHTIIAGQTIKASFPQACGSMAMTGAIRVFQQLQYAGSSLVHMQNRTHTCKFSHAQLCLLASHLLDMHCMLQL